jgi:hypothetical protein
LFKSCRKAVELAGIDLLFCFRLLLPRLMGMIAKREVTERSFLTETFFSSLSQWPRGVRHELVFAHSNAGIGGSNPTQGMDVCVRLFSICVVLCVGSGLATG